LCSQVPAAQLTPPRTCKQPLNVLSCFIAAAYRGTSLMATRAPEVLQVARYTKPSTPSPMHLSSEYSVSKSASTFSSDAAQPMLASRPQALLHFAGAGQVLLLQHEQYARHIASYIISRMRHNVYVKVLDLHRVLARDVAHATSRLWNDLY
jgi:hypothetical protein